MQTKPNFFSVIKIGRMLTPRELAIQIKDEARKFAFGSMVRAVVAYGGTSTGFQMRQLFGGK